MSRKWTTYLTSEVFTSVALPTTDTQTYTRVTRSQSATVAPQLQNCIVPADNVRDLVVQFDCELNMSADIATERKHASSTFDVCDRSVSLDVMSRQN